jgi:hypothetical protein
MVYVAATCGLRFSEVAGLRVGRVDTTGRRLRVLETAPQVGGDRAEPKTDAGRRTVPMPGVVAEMLDQHLERYELTQNHDALVFTAERGGRLHAANWHKRAWMTARANAGFPSLRFHDLRHSAVPLWVSMGANLLQVSRWLGHSTVQITADVYGHLFTQAQQQRVLGYIEGAVAEGAVLAAQAPLPSDPCLTSGYWAAPTLFTGVTPSMTIAREEVFGPVTAVLRFSGEAEALALANDTPYGLCAAVYTADHTRARRLARGITAGVVMINNYNRAFLGTPFGGFGDSGYGREHAVETLLEFTRTKTIREPSGIGEIPYWSALDDVIDG